MENSTIKSLLKKSLAPKPTAELTSAAELLLAHSLKQKREWILAHGEYCLTKKEKLTYQKLWQRYQQDEPLAHLLGYQYFYGLKFAVNKNTLIPRPETELLVEKALAEIENDQLMENVLDIGTGSGAIAVSLAKTSENLTSRKINFWASDISAAALEVARENAQKHKVTEKIEFEKSDLLPTEKFKSALGKKSNWLILANLPYLSAEIYAKTAKNVKAFEPKSALLSGPDGLDHYRRLLSQCKSFFQSSKTGLILFLEISPEQKNLIEREIKITFPTAQVFFFRDLAQKWRLVKVKINF